MKYLKYLLVILTVATSAFWLINKKRISIPSITTGSTFSFAIEADPHMDEQSSADVYKQTLNNIVAAKPDFLIDLGDTFMLDKQPEKTEASFIARYQLLKNYFDLISPIPVYLVSGNHDGETGWETNHRLERLKYFPSNYSKNYYSFTKSNVLFIILDPYSFTATKPNNNGWDWTLGKTQYDWLKNTLANSNSQYKFVFIHQLVGGDNQGRGGVEFARLYEWGGNNLDGSYGFNTNRSSWGKPIHQLLVDNKVNAVFKGHDHFFAKQDLDGVVYQTLPQPSHPGDKINTATEYGYISGKIIGGSGFLNVTVSPSSAKVDFVGTQLPSGQKVVYSYNL